MPFERILPYDPHDYETWNFGFRTHLMLGNYVNILDGKETSSVGSSSNSRRVSGNTDSTAASIQAEDSLMKEMLQFIAFWFKA